MTVMQPNDPIAGRSRGTADEVMKWCDAFDLEGEIGEKRYAFTRAYLEELERLCAKIGFDFAIAAAQAANETGDPDRGLGFLSKKWVKDGVPVGLGVTDHDDQSSPFDDPRNAARAHLVHLSLYVLGANATRTGPLGPFIALDYRFDIAINAGRGGVATTIADLSSRWATQRDYAERICARGMSIWPSFSDSPANTGGAVMPPEAKGANVLLIAGHRNRTGGNEEEKSLTDDLARAYDTALTAAGHKVTWQERDLDGDSLPDSSAYGLDGVATAAYQWGLSQPGDNLVILDLHFESGGGASGCFAIVADRTGLRTAAPVPQMAGDVLANMNLDLKVGRQITRNLSAATGLPLREGNVIESGIMLERQTGVGGDGWRLATFAYTSPLYMRAVRLVVEHGALDNKGDHKKIKAKGFFEKAGQAAAEALTAIYGTTAGSGDSGDTNYPDSKPNPSLVYPDGLDYDLASRWFGVVKRGGATYQFDEHGPVSTTWLNGEDFSPLTAVEKFDEREYFRFAGGLVLWRPNANSPIRKLGDA